MKRRTCERIDFLIVWSSAILEESRRLANIVALATRGVFTIYTRSPQLALFNFKSVSCSSAPFKYLWLHRTIVGSFRMPSFLKAAVGHRIVVVVVAWRLLEFLTLKFHSLFIISFTFQNANDETKWRYNCILCETFLVILVEDLRLNKGALKTAFGPNIEKRMPKWRKLHQRSFIYFTPRLSFLKQSDHAGRKIKVKRRSCLCA
jgi:hypothetical protein